VLGYAADGNGNLDTTQLVPLRIPFDNASGSLTNFSISSDGQITGHFADGTMQTVGQIRFARFANPDGLIQMAGNVYAESFNSGQPVESDPGQNGSAGIVAGAVEQSTTDIGENLVDMMLASTQFRANVVVLETADKMAAALSDLRRSP
jgi:flagellar hook protein FlgE